MTSSSSFSVEATSLGKRFNREWIFKNLNYTFRSGNTYAITGPNGSGKSTLLQLLWGQVPPTAGTIRYQQNGKDIGVEEVYKHVSIATPYLDLIEEFTLEEQLRFHFNLRKSRGGITIPALLDVMELTHAKDKALGNFSSGMRQRVKLALAFFTEASIVFLDEPLTNLDQSAANWYHKQLESIKDSLIFIASNSPEEYKTAQEILNIRSFK